MVDWNGFSYFWSASHPDISYRVSSQLAFRFRRRSENIFSRWPPQWPSWIFDRNNFSYFFYLQVTLMLPTGFLVNWPFDSGENVKNIFSRWRPWRPSRILDRNDCSYFWSEFLTITLLGVSRLKWVKQNANCVNVIVQYHIRSKYSPGKKKAKHPWKIPMQ